jgi:hypothetical protein
VTPEPRFCSRVLSLAVLALAACHSSDGGMGSIDAQRSQQDAASDADDDPTSTDNGHRHPDARLPDAGVITRDAGPVRDAGPTVDAGPMRDAGPTVDAGPAPDAGGGGGGGGTISCFTEGNPGATCALPTHCCFTNYSAQHDGECSNAACAWGTIECDGPEDCATGQHCCAHLLSDPVNGNTGYRMSCQSSACGAAPVNQELCHPTSSPAGTCSTGHSCVSALDNDNDLPRTLYICK